MSVYSNEQQEEVEALRGLIAWFHRSSGELTQEYGRLEKRVAELNSEIQIKNRELEKSLGEREEARGYLLSVLESLKAGVLVLDQELRPTFVNRRLHELAGKVDEARATQLLGDTVAQCIRRGERYFLPLDCERVVQGPGGITTPVHLTISEVVINGEKSAGYVLVFQDISRIKSLEAEAARSRRLAALGEMAAGVAHEIRSPLVGIELYASLLKEKQEGEPQRVAGEILKAVQRLNTTITRLLSFAAEPRITSEVLPVSLLLREVEDMAWPILQGGKWGLKIDVEPELPPLWGDRGLLGQAIFNLVANATEAMSEGGMVRIQAKRSPLYSANGRIHRALEIRVSDEGTGIRSEDREKIFDPFFSTKPKGTGLGLALAHKITTAHSGSIEISSELGRGSCFTVSFPVADRIKDYAEANCHS